ncbi:MAG: hypothetical protein WC234_04875 [Endomicrobiaceae bacterium]
MKNIAKKLKSNFAQSTTEYILFITVIFIASCGMIKLFSLVWKYKFNLISLSVGTFNAIF